MWRRAQGAILLERSSGKGRGAAALAECRHPFPQDSNPSTPQLCMAFPAVSGGLGRVCMAMQSHPAGSPPLHLSASLGLGEGSTPSNKWKRPSLHLRGHMLRTPRRHENGAPAKIQVLGRWALSCVHPEQGSRHRASKQAQCQQYYEGLNGAGALCVGGEEGRRVQTQNFVYR